MGFRSALVMLAVMSASACAPSATGGVGHGDIDTRELERTVLAVAASRSNTTPFEMKGRTVLIDRQGDATRIDNDGMDTVALAYEGGVLGFTDTHHDYLLGTERPVRARSEVPSGAYGSFLVGETLVSLFNGGFGEKGYDLTIAEAGPRSVVRHEVGYLQAAAQCGNSVWAALTTDELKSGRNPRIVVKRIYPKSDRSITMRTAKPDFALDIAACRGDRLVALGDTQDEREHYQEVVADLDVKTGRRTVQRQTWTPGALGAKRDTNDNAAALLDDSLYVVRSRNDPDPHVHELQRVNLKTGRTTKIVTWREPKDVYEQHFKFIDGVLYVLDVTRDVDSRVTAYDPRTGERLGQRSFAPIDNQLNGKFTSFDAQQFVRDFAVLQPVDTW